MSRKKPSSRVSRERAQAPVFGALGDETRLSLLTKLADGQAYSIAELTRGYKLSRQAITKHLRVLESVGIVHSLRAGRENRFAFNPKPIMGIREYLDLVSQQWDEALGRLKSLVED